MDSQNSNSFDNAATDDILERAIASHQLEVAPPGPSSELVAKTLRALDELEQRPLSVPLTSRNRMKRYLVTAAGLLLAVGAFAVIGVLFRTQTNAAFAQIVEPILKAKTARFKVTIEHTDLPRTTSRAMVSGAGRLRSEMPTGQIQILDFDIGRGLMLNTADKSGSSFSMDVIPQEERSPHHYDLLRTGLRSSKRGVGERESLGSKQINGRDTIGYRVKLKEFNDELTIWGDPATGLPVMAEFKLARLPDCKFSMTDFEFDIELDTALFDTKAPQGYTVVERTFAQPTEKDLIAGFKQLAEHNGGIFPDVFDMSSSQSLMFDFTQNNPGMPVAEVTEKALKLTEPSRQGFMFAVTLPADANTRYAGKGIKLGDAAAAVFWYKSTAVKKYRVIHGDLSITEQSEAPESPNAAPVTISFSLGDKFKDLMKKPSPEPPLTPPRPVPES